MRHFASLLLTALVGAAVGLQSLALPAHSTRHGSRGEITGSASLHAPEGPGPRHGGSECSLCFALESPASAPFAKARAANLRVPCARVNLTLYSPALLRARGLPEARGPPVAA